MLSTIPEASYATFVPRRRCQNGSREKKKEVASDADHELAAKEHLVCEALFLNTIASGISDTLFVAVVRLGGLPTGRGLPLG